MSVYKCSEQIDFCPNCGDPIHWRYENTTNRDGAKYDHETGERYVKKIPYCLKSRTFFGWEIWGNCWDGGYAYWSWYSSEDLERMMPRLKSGQAFKPK